MCFTGTDRRDGGSLVFDSILHFTPKMATLALVVAAGWFSELPALAQSGLERRKAQYLFTLAKFIAWPKEKFPLATTPIRVGFVGSGGVRDLFEEANSSLRVGQRPIATASVYRNSDVRDCHILFVQPVMTQSYSGLLSEARRRHVLTVGHGENFIRNGGMVQFVGRGNSIQMLINERAVRGARLRIDARVLAHAQIVDDNGNPIGRGRPAASQP